MAREIALAVLAAAACMAIASGFMFAQPSSAPVERSAYAPEDIRYSLQQADAKKKKRKPSKPAPEKFAPSSSTSSGGDVDTSDEPQEAPSEESEAEEPPIE